MCGHVVIGGSEIWIDCQPRHWPPNDPGPLIDLTRLKFGRDEVIGPQPQPWRTELTQVMRMLDAAGRLGEAGMANKLGSVLAEIGTEIALNAEVDVRIEWEEHDSLD